LNVPDAGGKFREVRGAAVVLRRKCKYTPRGFFVVGCCRWWHFLTPRPTVGVVAGQGDFNVDQEEHKGRHFSLKVLLKRKIQFEVHTRRN